ncbi:unnamed protein product [Fraxinus pennsylvanica]|uniref:Uncharacterized protein n=1 Tax=Fraxinus pennsylvanica TaxID=56036 RepID=A0AAD2A6G3_9LAMI|nr:unnamed protein product [Fraxinus pennsylvanica]
MPATQRRPEFPVDRAMLWPLYAAALLAGDVGQDNMAVSIVVLFYRRALLAERWSSVDDLGNSISIHNDAHMLATQRRPEFPADRAMPWPLYAAALLAGDVGHDSMAVSIVVLFCRQALLAERWSSVDGSNCERYDSGRYFTGIVNVANETICRPTQQMTEMKGHETKKHALAFFGGASFKTSAIWVGRRRDRVWGRRFLG